MEKKKKQMSENLNWESVHILKVLGVHVLALIKRDLCNERFDFLRSFLRRELKIDQKRLPLSQEEAKLVGYTSIASTPRKWIWIILFLYVYAPPNALSKMSEVIQPKKSHFTRKNARKKSHLCVCRD